MSTFPPLGLSYVAAVTPSNWDVKIADENFDEWAFEVADLVGITALTSSINRANEIAQSYRRHHIKVLMGGIHASLKKAWQDSHYYTDYSAEFPISLFSALKPL